MTIQKDIDPIDRILDDFKAASAKIMEDFKRENATDRAEARAEWAAYLADKAQHVAEADHQIECVDCDDLGRKLKRQFWAYAAAVFALAFVSPPAVAALIKWLSK